MPKQARVIVPCVRQLGASHLYGANWGMKGTHCTATGSFLPINPPPGRHETCSFSLSAHGTFPRTDCQCAGSLL
jgi:hypothetical protein